MTTVPANQSNDLIFGRQPAIWIAVVTMVLNGFVLFTDWLTQDQATVVAALISAVLGFIVVFKVAELAFPAFMALAAAGVQVLLGFGLDLSEDVQAWLGVAAPAVIAMILWPNLHPTTTPDSPIIVEEEP